MQTCFSRRKSKSLSLALLLLVFWFNEGLAQGGIEEESLVAALTLNTLRFTTWPQAFTTPFNLCVFADNITEDAFVRLESKKIGSTSLHVVTLAHLNDLDQCNALYIKEIKQNTLFQVFNQLKKKPILTIGLAEHFAENGGMIGLRHENDKLVIDINLQVLNESGIILSSRLLSLSNILK